eukprot:gb/GEZN01006646.1/.p1 GENE.gb/GEZN01006646.1/~~gb/GEZN01006646.1/.p1  ORF type:complete len:519 (-),score=87.61 gb/GEZN01006646.1/:52-1608(-)
MSIFLKLAIICLTYFVGRFLKDFLTLKCPYFFQILDVTTPSPFNLILSVVVPVWLTPFNRKTMYDFGSWSSLHKNKGDVVACVSPMSTQVIVADAQVAREITTTKKERFVKPKFSRNDMMEVNLFNVDGKVWKRHRKIMSYAFTERNNKMVVTETRKAVGEMMIELKNKAEQDGSVVVDISPYADKIALNVICSSSFGIPCSWNGTEEEEQSFIGALKSVLDSMPVALTMPRLIIKKWNPKLLADIKLYHKYINDKVAAARAEMTSSDGIIQSEGATIGDDLFSLLIKTSSLPDAGKTMLSLNDEELRGNIFLFLIAGQETSAHTLAFALGLLALYPDVQQKCLDEIKAVCGDHPIVFDDAVSLKYVDAVIRETLRLYPVVNEIVKKCAEDTEVVCDGNQSGQKLMIPKGSSVFLNIRGLQTNEKYWGKDAQDFRPERFLGEYNKDAFCAFSAGPRVCIGRRFATLELMTVLTTLVQNYSITPPEGATRESLLKPHVVLTMAPANAVNLKFTPRHVST